MTEKTNNEARRSWREADDIKADAVAPAYGYVWSRVRGLWTMPSVLPDGSVCHSLAAAGKRTGAHPATVARMIAHRVLPQPSLGCLVFADCALLELSDIPRKDVVGMRRRLAAWREGSPPKSTGHSPQALRGKLAALREIMTHTDPDLDAARRVLGIGVGA